MLFEIWLVLVVVVALFVVVVVLVLPLGCCVVGLLFGVGLLIPMVC